MSGCGGRARLADEPCLEVRTKARIIRVATAVGDILARAWNLHAPFPSCRGEAMSLFWGAAATRKACRRSPQWFSPDLWRGGESGWGWKKLLDRVFFDANVVFSGLYAPGGPPARLLDAYVENRIVMVLSQQVLTELVRTLQAKIPRALPALYLLLSTNPPEILEDPPLAAIAQWARVVHPADAPIVAAATAGQVECLVTGNAWHYRGGMQAAAAAGLSIVTPGEMVAVLEGGEESGS